MLMWNINRGTVDSFQMLKKKRRGRWRMPVEWYIVVPLSSGRFFCWIKFKIRIPLCLASKLSHFQVAIYNLGSGGGEKQVKMSSWGILVINLLGSSRAGFLNLNTIDILGWIIFVVRSCAVHCRMLASSLAMAYWMPIISPTPKLWQPKMSMDLAKCPLRDEVTPSWEPLT